MASRVSPKESCVVDIYDNGSSFSVKHIPDGESAIEPTQNENNTREQLLQAIGEVYRPVLSLMKLSGIYFGCTILATAIQLSGQRRGTLISFCFGCVVVSGMWFNFVMPVVSTVVEGHLFRRIMIIFWCLLVALLGTTCLFVFSSTASRTSRFEEFILKVISIKMVNPCLKKAKSRSRIFLIIFILLVIATVVGAFCTDLILEMNIANALPWKNWVVFRFTSLLFLTFGCGVWLFPFPFFCSTCFILEELFDDLYDQILQPNSNSLSIAVLRKRHHDLCQVVEMADRVHSPLILEIVAFSFPVICFNFYVVINSDAFQEQLTLIVNTLFWLLISSATTGVIMIVGAKVSEKVRAE